MVERRLKADPVKEGGLFFLDREIKGRERSEEEKKSERRWKSFPGKQEIFPLLLLSLRENPKKSKARKCCANGLNYKSLTTSLIVVVFSIFKFQRGSFVDK